MERLGQERFLCCPKDFIDELRDSGLRADITQVRSILKDSWGVHSGKNGEYTFYHVGIDGEFFPMKRKGRYFEIPRLVVDKILL
jgi:hypothetical protein